MIRYSYTRKERNTFTVARSAPQPFGAPGFATGTRTFERIGSIKYTKKRGWHTELGGTYITEAVDLANLKFPSGPSYGQTTLIADSQKLF